MIITTSIDFSDDRYFVIDDNSGARELSEKTVDLLETLCPGNTLVLKDKIGLTKSGRGHSLFVSAKLDGIYLKINEKIEDILGSLSNREIEDWATELSKNEWSDINDVLPYIKTLDKKDIFLYILDNHTKGNLQIKDTSYSVRGSRLTIRIECETKFVFKAPSGSKAVFAINDTLLNGPEIDRILHYAQIHYGNHLIYLKQLLIAGRTAWIPMEQKKAHAMLAFLYLNAKSLKQIVLTETSNIYKLQYVNSIITDMQRDPREGSVFDDTNPNSSIYSIPKVYKGGNSSLLGCFSHYTYEQANALKSKIKGFNGTAGGYIFLCPFTIEEYKETLWEKNHWDREPLLSEKSRIISNLAIQGVENGLDLLYKMVLLHEIGHLCCFNTSRVTKRKDDETLANWIASMNLTLFERDFIENKTKYQPVEYQHFITLPYYGARCRTPGRINDAKKYENKIVKLLKDTAR